MRTNQIYIARDGKSGMHVLVRILAVDDIGKDYLPIDPDDFNKLMMARDVRSLVLAARDLGPMYISADILSRRIFIPSHLQQHIGHGVNLAPSDIESLLSECYFDPYALPVETDDMGYRAIGRTGKKSARELIDDFDFTIAGDLSYLDSQFRAIVEPLHDWIFARNLISILIRIGGLYRSGADPDTILEAARFRQVNSMVLKKRFDIESMYHYGWYIANQLVTFNDALRALVVFRNRDASSRALRSVFPAFSSWQKEYLTRGRDDREVPGRPGGYREKPDMAPGGASGDRRTAGIGLPDARLYGKCSEVHGSVRRQAPRGGQVCGGPGEGRAGPQDVTVVIEKASPATLAAAAKKSAAAGIADSRRDDPAKTIR